MSAPYKVDLMNTGSELCRAWVTQGRRVICIANGMQGLTVTEMNREVRERGEKIARALALLNRVGDAAADALIKGEAAVTMWQPIETAPFNDTCSIVLWHGGHVSYEDLDHDSDAAWWRERGATHWALMPPPLAAGRLDARALDLGPVVAAALKESAP
jgi:hypothetical protein